MGAFVLVLVVVLAVTPLEGTPAEPSLEGARFEGVWQVQPRPPRGRGRARPPGRPGRPLGAEADEKGLTTADFRVRRMMTEAGQAAFDRFDPYELPANNCVSPGLPSIAMTPYLQEWRVTADTLHITHEYYSTRRTVHLNAETPADMEPALAGHATGRLEDGVLVIETTALAPTLGGLSRNAPSSDARVVTERYRVLPEGRVMEGHITIEDRKYLTQPLELSVRLRRAQPGVEIVLFPCDVEAARRHLKPRP